MAHELGVGIWFGSSMDLENWRGSCDGGAGIVFLAGKFGGNKCAWDANGGGGTGARGRRCREAMISLRGRASV